MRTSSHRTRALALSALAAVLVFDVALATAADKPVSGQKLQLKRSSSGKEKLVFLTKDPSFLFPAIASADNPASGAPGGMTIELFSQTEPSAPSLAVPPGVGNPGWKIVDGGVDSYKYTNKSAPAGPSPVKVAILKQGKMIKITAAEMGLALAATQGRVAIRVTTGSLRSCAVFGPGSIKRDAAGNFMAVRAPVPAITDCSNASLSGVATTTTTTTVPGSTTTTTAPVVAGTFLDLTTTPGSGVCGITRDGASAPLKNLSCGGLDIGGGNASVAESIVPDGATNRFALGTCTGSSCPILPTSAPIGLIDCTSTGCAFGPPLPIPNAGQTTCVVNSISAPVGGTFDLATGATSDLSLQLASHLFITGNAAQPCPKCSATGTPSAPGTGTCDRGARAGLACTSTNSQGLSKDCIPGGGDGSINLGDLPIDLTPLSTGQRLETSADGLFCPGQGNNQRGCFQGGVNCRSIEENGAPAGPLTANGPSAPVGLGAIFCIPTTSSPLVNFAANLPGPGAFSIVGDLALRQIAGPTTTTSIPTTTSTSTTVATTSTSTSTTTPTSSTTTTTLPAGTQLLDFTTTLGSGNCGATRDGSSTLLQNIRCSGLDLGGGASSVPEGLIPDGATNRFALNGCAGNVCQLAPTTGRGNGIDCTSAGCFFGPPLPIPNAGLTVCVVNTFGANGGGSVDKGTGAVTLNAPLSSHVFLTGDPSQPCPRCSTTGSPGSPATGTCDRGARQGQTCETTNTQGLSADCAPGGSDGSADLGSITVDLSPLVTSTASDGDPAGLFCPGQTTANDNQGCFGETTCRSISVNGLPAGPLVFESTQAVTLASTFCIPAVGNLVIDGAASLPGPGAASLPGTVTLREIIGTTTTSTTTPTTSSTSTTGPSTTTTSPTTTTTTSTLLPPLLPLTVEFASGTGTGACGNTRDGNGNVIRNLNCGDLALGHGLGSLPPSALPDGAVVHFDLGGCSVLPLLTCSLTATPTAGPGFDCSTTGCFFGPPVPIPNGGLSACSVSNFTAPVSGSVNLLTGATTTNVSLGLHVFVTGNATQPCPRCSAMGAPGAPGSGTCDRGARAGLSCSTTNSQGLSKDCLPGGADGSIDVGTINASLSPVTTGTVSLSNPSGLFCPGQTQPGCFGSGACRSITETGVSPGVAITSSLAPQPATLVSTFCVPATGNALLDSPAGLPGPAAISLQGTVRSQLCGLVDRWGGGRGSVPRPPPLRLLGGERHGWGALRALVLGPCAPSKRCTSSRMPQARASDLRGALCAPHPCRSRRRASGGHGRVASVPAYAALSWGRTSLAKQRRFLWASSGGMPA
jgi:hypothetical protein